MLKFKKKLSTVLAVGMIASMSTSAFAAQPSKEVAEPNVEVIALSADIDASVLDKVENSVGACLVYKDGTTVPIDAVVTVEKMPTTAKSATTTYAVTVRSKLDTDTDDLNTSHTNASATLRLLWTDGPDIQNVIDEVSGTLHVEKGKVLSGTVLYGNRMVSSMLWTKKEVGSAPSFTFKPNMTVMSPAASYSVGFEDEIFGLSLSVASTIFQ